MRLLSLALASLLGGCVAQGLDTNQSSDNIITSNYYSFFRLAGNHLEASALANTSVSSAQIADSSYQLTDAGLALTSTADGREVLTYIVSCALPAGTVLTDPSTGQQYFGQIGLAASWINHPMTLDQQRWVSACLYSRVNNFGVAVEISLRGSDPALKTNAPSEVTDFTQQEGAFYGQYFDASLLEAYACSGDNVAAAAADQRVCAEDGGGGKTPCGFTYTGQCDGDGSRHKTGKACAMFVANAYYENCDGQTAAPSAISHPRPASDSFSQVITVYVQ